QDLRMPQSMKLPGILVNIDPLVLFFDIDRESPECSLEFREEIIRFCHSLSVINRNTFAFNPWITSKLQIISVPLRSERNSLASFSRPDVPGAIYMDIFGGFDSHLELMIHETAHLHFFAAEATEALFRGDREKRYWSPLRPDPRPVRGI